MSTGQKYKYVLWGLLMILAIAFFINRYFIRQPIWVQMEMIERPPLPYFPPEKKEDTSQKKQITVVPQLNYPDKSSPIKKTDTIPLPKIPQLSPVPPSFDLENATMELQALKIHPEENTEFKKIYIPPVKYKSKLKDYAIPGGLFAAGLIASRTNYKDFINLPRPSGKIEQKKFDDVLQLVVPATLYVYDIVEKEKHHPIDQFFVMTISYGLMALQVRNIKPYINEFRPDNGRNSFPSGHTATAFVGAHMIYKEFKDTNPWIAYSGYIMASAVGAGRILNNRHWICDVVAGAGIAMLSVELAYAIYFPIRNIVTNEVNKWVGKYIIIFPSVQPKSAGLQMNITF